MNPAAADRATKHVAAGYVRAYAIAVLAVGIASFIRWSLPEVFASTPYLVFLPAVLAAAALGGLGPGVLATGLSVLCLDLLFTGPVGQLSLDPVEWTRHAVFVVFGVGFSVVAGLWINGAKRQRHQAAELEESLRKYRAVADYTHDWEFWQAPDGRYLYVSPACINVTGYAAQEFMADPDLAERIIHTDDLARVRKHRGLGAQACATPEVEFRILHRKGDVRWIGHACVPIYDDAGTFLGIRGSNRDITERKMAQQAMAENQQRLSGVINSAMDAIITVNEEQKIVLFNPAAQKMFLCPAAEAIGSPIDRFIPERFRAAHEGHIRHFGATGQTSRAMGHLGSISGLRANGEEFPIEASISQVTVHGRKLYTVILRDITERVRAQEMQRNAEARYRTLFESIDEGFCVIEMIFDQNNKPVDYRFLEVNPSFAKQTGIASAQGKRMRELAPLHEEHWYEAYGRIALTGEPARFQAQAKELHRWYDVYGFRVGAPESRQVAVLFSDITQRRAEQEALASAKVSAERAKAAAEAASTAKDHFMAVLSHELRNPLTPVLATASMLHDDPRFDRETRESLEVIRRNAELEARLIDDLLDVTRISRGKVELDLQPVELCTVLRHAVEVCQPDIDARRLHFGLDVKDPPHVVRADPGRLQQVFWNIIKNAVKFTPHSGCVGVQCWREDSQVLVKVSDSGVGIEPAALAHIFNAFEQAGVSVTRQFGGLGLGLAISKALVEMHGGTISASSEGKDKGASFTVRLPLNSVPVSEAVVHPPPPQGKSAKPVPPLRVLLVEDHGDTAHIMTQLLQKQGCYVQAAGDVATAMELAGQQRFDLLLSDLGLPDGSGLELLNSLRARSHIFPAIALSGYGQDQDVRQSLAAGFAIHLTKPVSVSRLAEAIRSLTGREASAPQTREPEATA